MYVVSQWWIGGLRTRKAKASGSIPEIISRSIERLANRLSGYCIVTAIIRQHKSMPNLLGLRKYATIRLSRWLSSNHLK
jgi:hypothetical protein